ncbi:thioredoxin-like protein [Drechslerella dactyloides]|uniref:Thioredoxin-like protein n=1 Tax=Drechslerella dactyloides TaxID=74499 RepID=A0AAD6IUN0_DREDA|nr:thioredoxin-like protein [Drechslerella dactyloides]
MASAQTAEKVQKTYHTKATGDALRTVEKHAHDAELKLFGSCFCPFVQVWYSINSRRRTRIKSPNANPRLTDGVNARKRVWIALELAGWGCYESTVLMEYVDDIAQVKLHPHDPKEKAHSRLWADHGSTISFVDVNVAPWILRCSRVLQPYRGWQPPSEDSRFGRFIAALEGHAGIKATTSGDELYLDSYERYADNRPNTSQVAKAINEGRGLP